MTRISRIGCGVSSARTVVTIGPSIPHSTILSPSFIFPFDKTTSSVVPNPSIIFTSKIVHSSSEMNIRFEFMRSCVSLTSSMSMSGIPSPEIAEVGTSETFRARFLFSS